MTTLKRFIVNLKGKIIRLVNHQREVLVVKVLRLNLRTTVVLGDTNLRFLNDTNGVALRSNLSEVITLR